MTLAVIVAVVVVLFLLGFMSKRRFGTLGLALAAGALLASQLTTWLSAYIKEFDIETGSLTTRAAASIVLTLLPAVLLLFSGPAYTKRIHAVIGAIAFALMGALLIIGPLSIGLPKDLAAQSTLSFIAQYSDILIAVGILGAVADAWFIHTFKPVDKKKK